MSRGRKPAMGNPLEQPIPGGKKRGEATGEDHRALEVVCTVLDSGNFEAGAFLKKWSDLECHTLAEAHEAMVRDGFRADTTLRVPKNPCTADNIDVQVFDKERGINPKLRAALAHLGLDKISSADIMNYMDRLNRWSSDE